VIENGRDVGHDGALSRAANFVGKLLKSPKKSLVDFGVPFRVVEFLIEPHRPVLELQVTLYVGSIRHCLRGLVVGVLGSVSGSH